MCRRFQLSIDELIAEAKRAYDKGAKTVMLFGVPNVKMA